MANQYHIYDSELNYVSSNYYDEQPVNSVDFGPQVPLEFAKLNQAKTEWIDKRTIIQLNEIKVIEYRKTIYNLYDSLYTSSLARALNKSGQGLSQSQLERLKQGYEQKKQVAEQYLANGTILNQTLFDTISFEESTDFVGAKLDNEIAYLNDQYGTNIPTENITRIEQYCYLIISKFTIGSQYWEYLKAYCEAFRSKLITNLDNLEFELIDARIALVLTITNETTLAEIQALAIQFNSI